MKILILGAGSIGSLFGGYLACGGHEVTLVARTAHVNATRAHGLTVITPEGTSHSVPVTAWTQLPSQAPERSPAPETPETPETLETPETPAAWDLVIVAVKTYSLPALLHQYAWFFPETECPVALLQNGLGTEVHFTRQWPNAPLLRILTSNGALRRAPGTVVHTGRGETVVGPVSGSRDELEKTGRALCAALTDAGLTARFTPEVQAACWKKAFVNVGINAFGALTGLRNGQLLEIPLLRQTMADAVREAQTVAGVAGIPLEPGDPVEAMLEVARRTAQNKNSMLQDLEKGRPTEIQAINGHVSQLGREVNVPTPINDVLTALVTGREKSHAGK